MKRIFEKKWIISRTHPVSFDEVHEWWLAAVFRSLCQFEMRTAASQLEL
jgi:hypothetical protein